MRRSVLLSCACLALLTAICLGAEWPGWRGPNKDGISPETAINKDWKAKPPKELWRVALSDGGHAGLAVSGGKLFIIDHQAGKDVVRAIDAATGKDAWTCPYDDKSKDNYGFSRATPLVDGGRVYTVSMMGNVLCLNEKDGKVVWQKNLVKDFGGELPGWQMACSPMIDGEKLILVPGGRAGAVLALKKDTGALIWRGGAADKPGYSTPVAATVAGKKQYVVLTSSMLQGVQASDGKALWSVSWKTQYDVNAPTPVVTGPDTVFITSGYGRGCALVKVKADGASIAWENKNIQSHFNTPLFFDGRLYGTTDPGDLVCLDAKTGDNVWRKGGFEKGGVAGVAGCVVAQVGNRGTLVLVEMAPAGYKELGRIEAFPNCHERAWSPPIVAEGKVFARDLKEVACFDIK